MAKIRLQTRYTLLCYIIQFTAAGFKGHIVNTDLLRRKRCEIALPDKVFRKGVIGCADRKYHLVLVFREPLI